VSPWRVILATMVIFACGVVTGSMITRTVTAKLEQHPANPAAAPIPGRGAVLQMQKVLDKQFDLTADQRSQIENIMKASQQRTQPLWDKIAPQMNDEIKRVRQEIREVLTPDQWKQFTDLMKRNNGNRKANGNQAGDGRPAKSVDAMPAPGSTN
jgi:Spy/CpxP family protein refolding chaperone